MTVDVAIVREAIVLPGGPLTIAQTADARSQDRGTSLAVPLSLTSAPRYSDPTSTYGDSETIPCPYMEEIMNGWQAPTVCGFIMNWPLVWGMGHGMQGPPVPIVITLCAPCTHINTCQSAPCVRLTNAVLQLVARQLPQHAQAADCLLASCIMHEWVWPISI